MFTNRVREPLVDTEDSTARAQERFELPPEASDGWVIESRDGEVPRPQARIEFVRARRGKRGCFVSIGLGGQRQVGEVCGDITTA